MKRSVNPMLAAVAILATLVIVALAWMYGFAPQRSRIHEVPGFGFGGRIPAISPAKLDAAKKKAAEARNDLMDQVRRSRETRERP